ncbi:MAG: cytochrome P450 [Rhodobacterales bacterium]|nr:cytochrome P450 [Rhodobacterales bacterium]MDX5389605.1 cytochrome P450 [Rhodobacterales bacterium]MDX5489302.1 cytochrome P450 [Rhodobacterales bacterium]
MYRWHQSPTDPRFVQDPYPAYARARRQGGPLVWWADYDIPCALSHGAVNMILRDRRFGREIPAELSSPPPAHLAAFYAVEDHSMLELEPPRHKRLRGLVLRAFTSGQVAALAPEIATLAHGLIDAFPRGAPLDLLTSYAQAIPVITIARLLGVPEDSAPALLAWSHAMVGMYQARRTRAMEEAADAAAAAFGAFLSDHIEQRRVTPADDLITHLIAAEQDGAHLSTPEMISTCILLLNAGHEATVHAIGNAVRLLLAQPDPRAHLTPDRIAATVEELLRLDPPLHMFTRYAYEDVTVHGHLFRRGDRVGLLLGAANRDPGVWQAPDRFDPARPATPHMGFGAGLHFCLGAPLARLELQIALGILFQRCPDLRLSGPARFADSYHFHGLDALMVET